MTDLIEIDEDVNNPGPKILASLICARPSPDREDCTFIFCNVMNVHPFEPILESRAIFLPYKNFVLALGAAPYIGKVPDFSEGNVAELRKKYEVPAPTYLTQAFPTPPR